MALAALTSRLNCEEGYGVDLDGRGWRVGDGLPPRRNVDYKQTLRVTVLLGGTLRTKTKGVPEIPSNCIPEMLHFING